MVEQITSNYDELKPLIELIKLGKLNDIRNWIAERKPLDLKDQPPKGARKKTPLQYAVDTGFHTVVETLLQAKVPVNVESRCCAINNALANRRFDLVQLLVEYGYDPKTVDMREVFATWDPELMEYLIDRGADPETGMPLARALIDRTRTALRVFMKYKDRFPSFQEQANIALRYHCKEGNLKWIALMLWAGADPHAPGGFEPEVHNCSDGSGVTAIGFALLYRHEEVLDMKQIKIPAEGPVVHDLFAYGCKGKGLDILCQLFKKGLSPNTDPNGGCPKIQSILERFEYTSGFGYYLSRSEHGHDTSQGREYLRALHVLAKYGGKWRPHDNKEINRARRSLLKMKSDYAVEFVWIMAKYSAASLEDINSLLDSQAMRRHLEKQTSRVEQILEEWRNRLV